MRPRMILVGGVVLCSLGLTLVTGSSVPAQVEAADPPPADLPNDVQNGTAERLRARYAAKNLEVAERSYKFMKKIRMRYPDRFSPEDLRRVSLAWFKAAVAVAESKPECIRAMSQYMERESPDIGKDAN